MLDCTISFSLWWAMTAQFLFLYDGLWWKWLFTLKSVTKNDWKLIIGIVGIKMSWVEKNRKNYQSGRGGRLFGTREYITNLLKAPRGNMISFLMEKFPWIWKDDGLLGSECLVVLSCSFTLKLMEPILARSRNFITHGPNILWKIEILLWPVEIYQERSRFHYDRSRYFMAGRNLIMEDQDFIMNCQGFCSDRSRSSWWKVEVFMMTNRDFHDNRSRFCYEQSWFEFGRFLNGWPYIFQKYICHLRLSTVKVSALGFTLDGTRWKWKLGPKKSNKINASFIYFCFRCFSSGALLDKTPSFEREHLVRACTLWRQLTPVILKWYATFFEDSSG